MCSDPLFILMKDQSKDIAPLPVAAGMSQRRPVQSMEVLGKLEELCAVAQGSRLALDDRQIMSPVIDGVAGAIMGSIDDALMFAYDLPLGDDQEVIGIDAQADGPIGEGRRHAVAVALQMHEIGRAHV